MFFTRRYFIQTALAGASSLAFSPWAELWAASGAAVHPCLFEAGSGYAPFIDPFLKQIHAGADTFISEKYASELAVLLDRWKEDFCGSTRGVDGVGKHLPARLSASDLSNADLRVLRSTPPVESEAARFPAAEDRSSDAFLKGLQSYFSAFERIDVAEFRMDGIQVTSTAPLRVDTNVHYDLSGTLAGSRREERTGEWKLAWEKGQDEVWRIQSWIAGTEMRARLAGPGFADVTAGWLGNVSSYPAQLLHGTDYWRTVLDGASGIDIYGNNGIAVGDYDGDGLDDVYICQPAGLPNRLYRNWGDGTFRDVSKEAGVDILDGTSCAIFADLNNSGHQDLVVVRTSGPLLMVNQGNGRFELKPDAFQFDRPIQGTFTGCAAADYNRDGLLDIYFCTYSFYQGLSEYQFPRPYYDAQNGPPNFLLKNLGNHSFTDVTVASGLDVSNTRYSFCCLWNDYNQDGWPDLYVVNDFGRKVLYRNNGNGTFSDVSTAMGVEDPGEGMSATWLDCNNDGRDDLYVVNMWEAAGRRVTAQPEFMPNVPEKIRRIFRADASGNTMLRNTGSGTQFEEATAQSGTRVGGWNWGSDAWDLDHDGYPDLYIANGFISGDRRDDLSSFYWRQIAARSLDDGGNSKAYADAWSAINEFIRSGYTWSGYQRNNLYLNNRDGSFTEAGSLLGLDCLEDSRSFALSDLDGDGRLEVLIKNRTAPQLRIFHNRLQTLGESIAFRLTGTKSNRDAIGAVVELETRTGRQRRSLQAGSGFLAQHTKDLHFGLGTDSSPVRAVVTWPSGTRQVFDGLQPGHRIDIHEGVESFAATPFRPTTRHEAGETRKPLAAKAEESGTWMIEPMMPPAVALRSRQDTLHSLDDAKGQVQLLTFGSSACDSTFPYWQSLDEASRRWETKRPAIIAVLLGSAKGRSSGEALPPDAGLSFPVVESDEKTGEIYSIFYRYLFDQRRDMMLPSSFLLDAEGRVVKVYRGAVQPSRIHEDAGSIPESSAERLKRALPFPGRYLGTAMHHNYFTYGVAFLQYGYLDQALASFQRSIARNPTYGAAYYNIGLIYLNQSKFDSAQESLEKAAALDPRNADAWNNLGVVYGQQGNYSKAQACFERTLKLQPTHLLALQNLVKLYRYQGRLSDAVTLLEKALAIDPSQADLHQGLAMLFVEEKDLARAKDEFTKAVQLEPQNVAALNGLGVVLMQMGDSAGAIKAFEECRRIAPSYDRPYLNLAVLYMNAGRRQAAHDLLAHYLATEPDSPDIRHALQQLDGGQ